MLIEVVSSLISKYLDQQTHQKTCNKKRMFLNDLKKQPNKQTQRQKKRKEKENKQNKTKRLLIISTILLFISIDMSKTPP